MKVKKIDLIRYLNLSRKLGVNIDESDKDTFLNCSDGEKAMFLPGFYDLRNNDILKILDSEFKKGIESIPQNALKLLAVYSPETKIKLINNLDNDFYYNKEAFDQPQRIFFPLRVFLTINSIDYEIIYYLPAMIPVNRLEPRVELRKSINDSIIRSGEKLKKSDDFMVFNIKANSIDDIMKFKNLGDSDPKMVKYILEDSNHKMYTILVDYGKLMDIDFEPYSHRASRVISMTQNMIDRLESILISKDIKDKFDLDTSLIQSNFHEVQSDIVSKGFVSGMFVDIIKENMIYAKIFLEIKATDSGSKELFDLSSQKLSYKNIMFEYMKNFNEVFEGDFSSNLDDIFIKKNIYKLKKVYKASDWLFKLSYRVSKHRQKNRYVEFNIYFPIKDLLRLEPSGLNSNDVGILMDNYVLNNS